MKIVKACSVGLLTIVGTSTCFAAVNKWTSLGPDGGFITALVIDPQTTSTVYAATASNGVFKSIDSGETWTAINSGLDRGYVQSVAMDPQATSKLYAVVVNHGVFKTVNGGEDWSPARDGLPNVHGGGFSDINAMVIDPSDPEIIYAGTAMGVYKN